MPWCNLGRLRPCFQPLQSPPLRLSTVGRMCVCPASSHHPATLLLPAGRSGRVWRFGSASPLDARGELLLVLALLLLGLPQLLSRRSGPAAGGPPASAGGQPSPVATSASLRLEARGGPSWVLVERVEGGTVYDAILEPGQSKVLPLGSGLKIRSGRPDLLYVGVGSQLSEPLGDVSDLDWSEFRP